MTEERRIQLVAEVDATGTRAGFNEIGREAGTMASAVAQRSQQAEAAVAGIGGGANRSAAQTESAGRNLIGSIQRTTAALEAGSRSGAAYYEVLARQRGVDPAILEPYLVQLRQMEADQKRVAVATRETEIVQARANGTIGAAAPLLNNAGMSARATAAALRGVPAQVTDIVTSLQGGQAPLTVLLQQGGQLKDMMGGAGNAAKALGGYVLGLVNPFTVAAVAAGGLAYVYHEGESEAKEYNRVLALSGNAAGTYAGQLSDMARNISKSVGTQGMAAETIAALVATGKVSASNIEQFSTVAIKGQRALGQSVADTAQEFAELARTPVATLEKLNEKYHFLTGSVYEHVKALSDQGRGYEAGLVAQQAFATGFDAVSNKVIANLGSIERATQTGKDAWKNFWDSALNVGRADSLQTQLAAVQKRLENSGPAKFPNGVTGVRKDERDADTKEETRLKGLIALEATKSNIAADQARFNAADLEWSKGKFQFLTRQKQLETELTAEREKGLAAGVSDAEINERLAGVRKKYADIYNDGVDSNIEALKRRVAIEDVLSQRIIARITTQRTLGNLTEDEAIKKTARADDEAFASRRASMTLELSLLAKKQNSLKDQQTKIGEIKKLDEDRVSRQRQAEDELALAANRRLLTTIALQSAGISTASGQRAGFTESARVQREYNEEIGLGGEALLRLRERRAETLAGLKDESAAALEAIEPGGQLAQIYREQAAAMRDNSAANREGFVKQRDPWANLQASVQKYGDEASDVGSQIGNAMTNAFKGAEDAFVGFVTTGKLSFSSLATSILTDIARIQAKKAIAGFVNMAIGGLFDQPSTGPGSSTWDGYGNTLSGARAGGGPVSSGLSYLVGEKGPEIFTPSSSGNIIPNHQLGGGGNSPVQITLVTNVTPSGNSTQSTGDSGAEGRAMAEALNAKMKEVIMKETRQGGILWNQTVQGAR